MRTGPDILRRFTPLPFVALLPAFGRVLRLETNSQNILRQVRSALGGCAPPHPSTEDFVWRLATDAAAGLAPPWPDFFAFSKDGLHCENIGQRSFFAVDSETRLAVGFLADDLVNDILGFVEFFLSRLFVATAVSLRLLAVSAACIAKNGKGLLLVGPTKVGKTVCSYAASKAGFDIHSDQVTFLESKRTEIHAWGDFWPVAFYPGAERLFPELSAIALPVQHRGATLLCVERHALPASSRDRLVLIGMVLLQEGALNASRLVVLDPSEKEEVLRENCLSDQNALSEPGFEGIARALSSLPAYRLASNGDPLAVIPLLHSLFEENA